MKVIALPEVHDYLTELIQILYDADYFGFIEDAEKYVLDLLREIETTLPTRLRKKLHPILRNMAKKCTTVLLEKADIQPGIYFSIYIPLITKKYF